MRVVKSQCKGSIKLFQGNTERVVLASHPLFHSGEWNSSTFSALADELPASTGSKDVAWIRWFLEFKALHCGFEEAMQGLENL